MLTRNMLALMLFILTAYLLHPYLYSLIWGGVLAIILFPLTQQFQIKNHLITSFLVTVVFALIILIPLCSVVYFAMIEFNQYLSQNDLFQNPQAFFQEHVAKVPILRDIFSEKTFIETFDIERISKAIPSVRNVVGFISDLILGLIFIILFVFNFLLYQQAIKNFFMKHVFNKFENSRYLCRKIILSVRAVGGALLITAAITGIIMTITYYFIGLPMPFLFGFITAFLSMIPFVLLIVYTCLAAFLMMKGQVIGAVVVLIVGLAIYFVMNNIVQPKILQEKLKMKFIISLLGMLAGIEAFGVLGIFLGPVILNLSMSLLKTVEEGEKKWQSIPQKVKLKKQPIVL